MRLSLFLAATLAASPVLAAVEPGDATQFAGKWRVAFPEAEGVIVNKPDATCDAPVVIEATDAHTIRYTSPGGQSSVWEIKKFGDNTPWWSDNGSMVAKWIEWEVFHLAPTHVGKAQWDRAKEYRLCPE